MGDLIDARGVSIAPGDTAIWSFDALGHGDALAEGVVLGEGNETAEQFGDHRQVVSLTPSGRVCLRVVRRSYSGEKPVVDVAPDRLVVLKWGVYGIGAAYLPPSPLPTQDEENRQRIVNLIEVYTSDLRATEVDRRYYKGLTLEQFHAHAARRLAELRKKLGELP